MIRENNMKNDYMTEKKPKKVHFPKNSVAIFLKFGTKAARDKCLSSKEYADLLGITSKIQAKFNAEFTQKLN